MGLTAKEIERFWSKVDRPAPDACWEWQAGKFSQGYGATHISRKVVYAHRVSYEIHNGPIPDGLFVCHSCDNPACVNPAHLWLGTQAENMHDCQAKGRSARKAARRNVPLTDAEVQAIRERSGERGSALAKEFGVSPSLISRIIHRTRWTHI